MADLKGFARELVGQMEKDLSTKLDWVAVDHWNTDNPHIHVLVRGRADDGKDLVISRDYISHGFRQRAAGFGHRPDDPGEPRVRSEACDDGGERVRDRLAVER